MSVPKIPFTMAVLNMKKNPDKPDVVTRYYEQVTELTRMLLNQYRMNYQDQEDVLQDLLLFTHQKKLHRKVEASGDPMSYYWTTFKREIWRKQREHAKKLDKVQKHGIFDQQHTDHSKGELDMLKNLGFKLEDFEAIEGADISRQDFDNLPEVETSTPKRGRPAKLRPGQKAEHWEKLFVTLAEKKQMTVDQIVGAIPMDKRMRLKNPANSAKLILREIAKRDGYKLTVSGEIFNLIGA